MAEDWRLTVRLGSDEHAHKVARSLHELELTDESFGGRVAVSGDGPHLFLYADSEADARQAQAVVDRELQRGGAGAEFSLDRWHHEEEQWEPASVPLPSTPAQHQAEHDRLEEQEEAESEASGIADWEVRIELASHHDAHVLGERLEQEGYKPVRRWKYLLVGAGDEDDAKALATRLQAEAPAGATVHVEPGSGVAWQFMPANPFAVLGGLGT